MIDYNKSGVSLDRADQAKRLIAKSAKATFTPEVLHEIGHFGGFFALGDDADSDVLVASTDGVGTKVLLGVQLGMIDNIGQDLVNHCVNDLLVCGARPLFFLDYMAFGRLEPEIAGKIGESLARGCLENGIALIGGETAEMPGLYEESHFDLAGTIVGIVKREHILDASRVCSGDRLIGLPSTGLHTNGYSLVRKIFHDELAGERLPDEPLLRDGRSLSRALMTPHRSYFPAVFPLVEKGIFHAMAHITGGGIVGNTSRVIPEGMKLSMDWNSWERPELYSQIQKHGNVEEEEMRRVFNLGIGLVAIVEETKSADVISRLRDVGEPAMDIGSVTA